MRRGFCRSASRRLWLVGLGVGAACFCLGSAAGQSAAVYGANAYGYGSRHHHPQGLYVTPRGQDLACEAAYEPAGQGGWPYGDDPVSGAGPAMEDATEGAEVGAAADAATPSAPAASAEKSAAPGAAPPFSEGVRPLSSPSLAPAPGQITAGVWDDLARWAFWRGLDANPDKRWAAEQWRLFPTARLRVHVSSGALSVSDARVRLRNQANQTLWRGRTDIHGRVNVFWGVNAMRQPGPFSLEVQAPSGYKTVRRIATGQTHMNVDLDTQNRASAAVDIMFMVDTTGSMGDELEYLKSEIKSVVRRVQQKHGDRLDLRLSVNFYRDRGDAYVVCSFPFGRDIEQVVRQIAAQQADGGGDFEESVELALHGAVAHHAWRQEARARVLFLVLDAPPHATAEIQQKVMDAVRQAARRGIRIIPVASSGIDKPTEFFLRGLSLVTNGKYVFLTDDSGIGNAHLEPTIGHYQIDYLNNILVKILTQATTGAKPN